jgi:CubicO group peptidase (beta-lactamase class C family)
MNKYILQFIVLCLTTISLLNSQTIVSEEIEEAVIKKFQKKLVEDGDAGSNVVFIHKNGKTIYHNIQNSNKKGDKLITDQTLFPIWSMSKPITTVAVLILREKNLLQFDDPVSKFIPSYANLKCKSDYGVVDCNNELKVIHLLTHRSGFVYYDDFMIDAIRADNLDELMENIREQPLEFEPGENYRYGLNQDILGKVVEAASGMSFYSFLKKYVFDPLEMKNTKFFISEEEKKLLQPLFIKNESIEGFNQTGITGINDLITYDMEYKIELGSLGLISTIADYSNFCSMLLNFGKFKNKTILSSSSISELKKKYAEGPHAGDIDFPGVFNGLGVYVIEDPSKMNFKAPIGLYGHGGYQSTEFFIDTKNNMYGVFLNRSLTKYNHRYYFIKSVYDSF